MRRSDLMTRIVGAASWPPPLHAQQPKPMRWVSLLLGAPKDADYKPWVDAFLKALQELGWIRP